MSKKDYQAIAAALYHVRSYHSKLQVNQIDPIALQDDIVSAIANVMAAGNPRFDRFRFMEACRTGKCKGMRPVAA